VGQGHIHDFHPGIPTSGPPAGPFWTAHIPLDSVRFDLGRVTASMRVQSVALLDTIPAPPLQATATMDIEWLGKTAEVQLSDLVNGFTGNYSECTATTQWSAQEAGFGFVSDPASTSKMTFAELGRERNGIFLRRGG
jgi:hypothetical protein